MDARNRTNVILTIVFTSVFTLTLLNQAVCAEKRTIVLATMNWEPHYGENLPNGGFFTVICRTAFQRVGYDIEVKFVPWKRAVEGAKGGSYDGVLGGYFAEERTQYFLYTDAITEVEEILMSRKGAAISFTSLRDLSPYRIGGIRGGVIEAQWKATGYLTLENTKTYEQNLQKLVANRLDVIIGERKMWHYLLKTKHPEWRGRVEEVLPIIQKTYVYIFVSKKTSRYKTIVADFNRGLRAIKEDGTYEDIVHQYGFNHTP